MAVTQKTDTAPVCSQTTIQQMIRLILDYWTEERKVIWAEYEKTNKSVPWREFERNYMEEKTCKTK